MNFVFQSTLRDWIAGTVPLAKKLWYKALLISVPGISVFALYSYGAVSPIVFAFAAIICFIGSLPAFAGLLIVMPLIRKIFKTLQARIVALFVILVMVSGFYGIAAAILYNSPLNESASASQFITSTFVFFGCIAAAALISLALNIELVKKYFSGSIIQKQIFMQTESQAADTSVVIPATNRTWIKALITGLLILVMLIPTVYVSNLVEERQARQEQVKSEVSSKWAGEQTITFPYLFIPYHISSTTTDGKVVVQPKHFIVLPEDLTVKGTVSTEERQRSIYRVLLYNSNLNAKGSFVIKVPEGVDTTSIDWNGIKICVGIPDFKGIQEKVNTRFNNNNYELTAGLPTNIIDGSGLSAPVQLGAESMGKEVAFEFPLKLKGSDELHFVPLAGNSHFTLTSDWNSPSFDGNTLPGERQLSTNGFEANWNFNKANLPFNTVLTDFNFKKDDYAFGVTLLQPTDQYTKTLRCVKYAILFIGLSFSLFFIVEVMQKKPFHPVQYILVGLALIVFYTLLLSISEFLLFDLAYLIASSATVLLITFYANAHFKSWKIAGLFTGVIGFIYAFIFVLIRLEDTALLVGSIGLFIILALAMYASRKVNWYGETFSKQLSAPE